MFTALFVMLYRVCVYTSLYLLLDNRLKLVFMLNLACFTDAFADMPNNTCPNQIEKVKKHDLPGSGGASS